MARKKATPAELTETDEPAIIRNIDMLSTGSTLLNLSLTNKTKYGLIKGKYYWYAGSSSSGKSVNAMTILAEAANNPNFDDYELIYDNVEDGMLMNIEKYYGSKLAARIKAPHKGKHSQTVEEMYYGISDLQDRGTKFIWITDSMDALKTKDDTDKFEERKDAHEKDKEVKGSYGMAKAKINSTHLPMVVPRLRETGSILLIISQLRDNVGASMFEEQDITAGGTALKFYATCQIWCKTKEKIKKSVKGKERVIGAVSSFNTKKNRISGKNRTVEVPILYSIGIDDVRSCVMYLNNEKHWPSKKGVGIVAEEFGFQGSEHDLVQHIIENDLAKELRSIVGQVWRDIEEACETPKENRYE